MVAAMTMVLTASWREQIKRRRVILLGPAVKRIRRFRMPQIRNMSTHNAPRTNRTPR
jgi:hypothetical protein